MMHFRAGQVVTDKQFGKGVVRRGGQRLIVVDFHDEEGMALQVGFRYLSAVSRLTHTGLCEPRKRREATLEPPMQAELAQGPTEGQMRLF